MAGPPPTVPQEVALARHAIDLDDDGHADILASITTETDTTLVLAPDGGGGVEFRAETGGGTGAPTTVDYLVGTADGGLSAEIVVGTTPGGELGGTWASPTVDTTHSGSSHAGLSGQPGSTDVAIADGGTGASTKAAAFDALSPMTTQDDIIIGGASGTGTRLGKGSDGQVLTVDPTTHHLVWATPTGGSGLSDPMTTRGDIIIRNASNVTARLGRGSAGTYLGSDGTDVAYAAVTDAQLSTSDITTNNASSSKHGFLRKLDAVATHYLDGNGGWTTPGGGSAVGVSVPVILDARATAGGNAQNPAVTITSVPSGSRIIFAYNNVGRAPTSLTCTNVTFTSMAAVQNGAGSYYGIWVGVVAGGSSGTTLTMNTASSNFYTICIVSVTDTLTPTAGSVTSGSQVGQMLKPLDSVTPGAFVAYLVGADNTINPMHLVPSIPGHISTQGASGCGTALFVGYAPSSGSIGGALIASASTTPFTVALPIT